MRQPRGRPRAASTASKIVWSPSVMASGWPGSVSASSACASASERASARGAVGVAKILDAGLEELVAALAALAEHLAEIGIAARRAGLAGNVVEADGDGEFRAQAQHLAGLALGQEDAAAQILAGHVEKRIGRLDHRHVDGAGAALGEERLDGGRNLGIAARSCCAPSGSNKRHGSTLRRNEAFIAHRRAPPSARR